MWSVVFVFICMGELCAMKIGGSRGESGSAGILRTGVVIGGGFFGLGVLKTRVADGSCRVGQPVEPRRGLPRMVAVY